VTLKINRVPALKKKRKQEATLSQLSVFKVPINVIIMNTMVLPSQAEVT
jgi:putative effector of murein hydrolase LrgA (UPF0299 family)